MSIANVFKIACGVVAVGGLVTGIVVSVRSRNKIREDGVKQVLANQIKELITEFEATAKERGYQFTAEDELNLQAFGEAAVCLDVPIVGMTSAVNTLTSMVNRVKAL